MATSFWNLSKIVKKKLVEKMPPKSFKPKLESKFDENFNFISKLEIFSEKLEYSVRLFVSYFFFTFWQIFAQAKKPLLIMWPFFSQKSHSYELHWLFFCLPRCQNSPQIFFINFFKTDKINNKTNQKWWLVRVFSMFCDVHSQTGNYPKESLANLVLYQI